MPSLCRCCSVWFRLASLAALGLSPVLGRAQGPAHDMYLCVSMAGTYVIGSQVPRLNGVYRTTDRQELVHLGFNHPRVDALEADPRDPTVLFIAGLNGVMRSKDGGRSWRIMTGWEMTEPKDIAIDPHQPDRVFVALPDGIGVSDDGGETWSRRQEGIRRAYTQTIVVDRAVANRLIAGTELGVYRSEDAGNSWQKVLATEATATDVQQSPHDPQHLLAATQSDGGWESTDGGRTWQNLRSLPRNHTLHNIVFDPSTPRRLAVCGWGLGVSVSEDGGRTWHPRNAGLPNTEVWRVAADPDFPGRLYASPHESPIHISDDFGRTWRPHFFEGATVWDVTFVHRR
jgi:photosystem II stability/assembly factor-like uncharacterized protein